MTAGPLFGLLVGLMVGLLVCWLVRWSVGPLVSPKRTVSWWVLVEMSQNHQESTFML